MMRRFRRAEGLTLIEATVVLSVLTILTLVLVPTVTKYITDSRVAAAHSEVATLAGAIQSFYSDTGFFPTTVDSINGRQGTQRIDLLISRGSAPRVPVGPVFDQRGNPVQVDVTGWLSGSSDNLENHLIRNQPGYQNKGGPNQFGWNGPYLTTTEISPDPWGNRYMVNIRFIDPSPGVLNASGQIKFAVLVISAGPNGFIETSFAQPKTQVIVLGDDIAFALQ